MARSLPAPFVPRPRLLAGLLLTALGVASVTGCGHRRTAMRPVYVGPTTVRPCPSGDCGGALPAAPATVAPSAIGNEPPLTDTSTTITGGSVIANPSPYTATPPIRSVGPSRPNSPLDSPPPVTGPSTSTTPPTPPEPELGPADPEDNSSKVPPAAPSARPQGSGAGANGGMSNPSALVPSGGNGRRSASARVWQASAREELRPFVNDPDDLFQPPKADRPWKYIVLHHSASPKGGYDSIDREHRKRLGWDGCGYHFIIGNGTDTPDGTVEVSQRWRNQKIGVHCRDGKTPDVSEYGIGICLVGDLEASPPTDRQIAAARVLVAYLSDRYQIAPDHAETHAHLAASPTSCPGRLFPAKDILNPSDLALR